MEYLFQLEKQLKEMTSNDSGIAVSASKTNPNEVIITVQPSSVRTVAKILKEHKNFQWLMDIAAVHYPEREQSLEVVYHFFNKEINRRVRMKVPHREGEKIPSITSVYKAANWYEREAFDMMGIAFEGHPDLTRILTHHQFVGHPLRKDYSPTANQVLERPLEYQFPVAPKGSEIDDDPITNVKNTLNLGPSHPATHGTFRWFVELEGETITRARTEIGYLHRCFEKMAETHNYNQIIPYTDRLNYCSAPMNNDGFCRTVEKLIGIEVPPRAQYMRVVLNELSRIIDHLVCIGTTSVDMGALTTFWYCFRAREDTYTLFEELCGNRMLTSITRVGGMIGDLTDEWKKKCLAHVSFLLSTVDEVDALLSNNKIWRSRMCGTGVISKDMAIGYGFTGPCLRASGVELDLRRQEPYYDYQKFDFEVPTDNNGDNFARYSIRLREMRESCKIIRQALEKMPAGPTQVNNPLITLPPKKQVYSNIEALMNHFMLIIDGVKPPKGDIYSYTEAANGELGFYLVSDGTGKPHRLKVRPPCFAIYQSFEEVISGGLIADAVATLGQMNVIAGELDR